MEEAGPVNLGNFFGPTAILLALLLALVLSVPISLWVLARYRKAVLKSMMGRAVPPAPPVIVDPRRVTTSGTPWEADRPPESPRALPVTFVEAAAPTGLTPGAEPLYGRFLAGPRRAALVVGAAGVVYALLAAILYLVTAGLEILPRRTAVLFVTNLWPLILTVPLVWREPGGKWYPVAIGVYLGLTALIGREHFGDLVVKYWLVAWLLPTVAVLILGSREIRAVGPFVLLATALFLFYGQGSWVGAYLVLVNVPGLDVQTVTGGLLLFALVGASVFAWLFVRGTALAHERHLIGEQTALLDCYYLAFTLWHTLPEVSTLGARGLLLIVPYLGYRLVVTIGMARLRRAALNERPLRLLLLRVFGSRSRSERLFTSVGAHWRYAGSIQMIAGTDLATATLEPNEFLDFMGGALSRRFIKGRADLSERLARLDTRPDADARFRVNEFFCHDDTWQDVLLRLVAESDVVLMDLREFSPRRQGCVFELHQILNLIPLGRVILLVDETTDVPFLQGVLEQGWDDLAPGSPNQGGRGGPLRVLNVPRGKDGTAALLVLLAEAGAHDGTPGAVAPTDAESPPGVPEELSRYA